jgi:lysophospholipase L1-like esterase
MHILVFGDSITQGFYDKEKGGWTNRLFIDVSASLESDEDFIGVFNLGIDSENTTGLLKRIENEILARKSEDMVIILDTGGNDTFKNKDTGENAVPFEVFSQNYAKLITTAKKYGRVFCIGFKDFNPEQAKNLSWYKDYDFTDNAHDLYDVEVERLAQQHGVRYIGMESLFAANFDRYSHDGDHPTAEGHEIIYQRVKETLVEENIL